ncbi:Uncharacterised protein [Vibrio harveyi]|nr:Uncharacterised protein [Vibrio harveyi]
MTPINPYEEKANYLNELALIASQKGKHQESDFLHYCAEIIRYGKNVDTNVLYNI